MIIDVLFLIPAAIAGFGFGIALASYYSIKRIDEIQKDIDKILHETNWN